MTNTLKQRIEVLRRVDETRLFLQQVTSEQRVGIVPTMGALHDGHLSLVDRARRDCDLVVATIFVNPTQFAPHEDFQKYPRTLERDLELLEAHGCHAAFVPDNSTMYPEGFSTSIEPPQVAKVLEGEYRPTHFAGVCTVVLKLFNIIAATDAYFGLKDYQQFAVLRQMILDLNHPLRLHGCATIREADGLAMSSRNRYLSKADRETAAGISRALRSNQMRVNQGELRVDVLEAHLLEDLHAAGIQEVQYATIRDQWTLLPVDKATDSTIALIAVKVGSTRLIDNMRCHA